MAKDYKDRANQNNKSSQVRVAWWKWLLILCLIAFFMGFLNFLQSSTPKTVQTPVEKTIKKADKQPNRPKKKVTPPPQFDFYTILPETEIVVPDYEINTRSREDHFTKKKKASQYLIQAGSFKQFPEADKLRARLALMGIESKVEKARIGNTVWNRVKIGPYSQLSSVTVIKKRLKSNNIDIIVTELNK